MEEPHVSTIFRLDCWSGYITLLVRTQPLAATQSQKRASAIVPSYITILALAKWHGRTKERGAGIRAEEELNGPRYRVACSDTGLSPAYAESAEEIGCRSRLESLHVEDELSAEEEPQHPRI